MAPSTTTDDMADVTSTGSSIAEQSSVNSEPFVLVTLAEEYSNPRDFVPAITLSQHIYSSVAQPLLSEHSGSLSCANCNNELPLTDAFQNEASTVGEKISLKDDLQHDPPNCPPYATVLRTGNKMLGQTQSSFEVQLPCSCSSQLTAVAERLESNANVQTEGTLESPIYEEAELLGKPGDTINLPVLNPATTSQPVITTSGRSSPLIKNEEVLLENDCSITAAESETSLDMDIALDQEIPCDTIASHLALDEHFSHDDQSSNISPATLKSPTIVLSSSLNNICEATSPISRPQTDFVSEKIVTRSTSIKTVFVEENVPAFKVAGNSGENNYKNSS